MLTYAAMERCAVLAQQQDEASLTELFATLQHPEWRVRYAALVALGDRRDARALAPLLALLQAEDAAPLYTQTGELGGTPAGAPTAPQVQLPPGVDGVTYAAWERRGRLKQAACFALAEIGQADPRVLAALQRYAQSEQDYQVRAAAARALGMLPAAASRPALEQAAKDEEWCTKTEARKALAKLA